ncbi:MAG: 3-isopropylmalate dehydratase small subunit, partial [Pseudomonadota bacterium]
NCFKNGILPVVLPKDEVEKLLQYSEAGNKINVDLVEQKVTAGNHSFDFEVDKFRKHCLLNGLDDIGLTMEKVASIGEFETKQKSSTPWLYKVA